MKTSKSCKRKRIEILKVNHVEKSGKFTGKYLTRKSLRKNLVENVCYQKKKRKMCLLIFESKSRWRKKKEKYWILCKFLLKSNLKKKIILVKCWHLWRKIRDRKREFATHKLQSFWGKKKREINWQVCERPKHKFRCHNCDKNFHKQVVSESLQPL